MTHIPQSTAKLVVFKAYLASDHVTEATGKTIAITISKNGGAFGNIAAGATNATEITSGWYKVSLAAGDTDTLGPLAIRGAVALIDDVGVLFEVVSATTGGLTNLDTTISSRMATYTQPTGFLAATFPGTVASTTNITGGIITTVTTVTNQLAASTIADGLLDLTDGIESGATLRQAMRIVLAANGGKLSGAGTTTEIFRNGVADNKNRITATVDSSGNRSAITYDLT